MSRRHGGLAEVRRELAEVRAWVILALAFTLWAIVLGGVGCWLLAGNCDPASVNLPEYRQYLPNLNSPKCTTCRAYRRTFGLV